MPILVADKSIPLIITITSQFSASELRSAKGDSETDPFAHIPFSFCSKCPELKPTAYRA